MVRARPLYTGRLPVALDAGTAFWIDHGWKRGDAFGVMQMVRIHNTGPIQASLKDDGSGEPAALWEILIEGVASGGEVTFSIVGIPFEVSTSAGAVQVQIATQIAQAINANATLQGFDIEATAIFDRVYVRGAVSALGNTDPTLMLAAAPGGPPGPFKLPALGIP